MSLTEDIFRSIQDPVVAFDAELRVIGFNSAHAIAFRRTLGRDQQVGDPATEMVPLRFALRFEAAMRRALSGEHFSLVLEFDAQDEDGSIWELSYAPLRDARGAIYAAFHQARDISQITKSQAELALAQEAMRQSQKMEAVGQLTGGVAHDFNNLLTVIRGSVDLLRRAGLPEEKRSRYIDAIGETAERATKLTGQLLAFARRQTLRPEAFDVRNRLQEITQILDSLTGARVVIQASTPEEPCVVRADASQFETALVNLAVNARDAMNQEGLLDIKVECGVTLPVIRGHGEAPGPFVKICMADNGCGIAPPIIDRIFEPFFTTKEVGKGTGLGLSQVFGFAKQSGGDVDVRSEPGKGTVFTLYLPEADASSVLHEAAPQEEIKVDFQDAGSCVLVVEDNIEVGRFSTQVLQEFGFRTRLVGSAEEALIVLGDTGHGFDAIFSDVVMPGMGGIELARQLRERLPQMPVILASGYSSVLAEQGSLGLDILSKPYSAAQLVELLKRKISSERGKRETAA